MDEHERDQENADKLEGLGRRVGGAIGDRVGGAIGEVFDVAIGTVGHVGAALGSVIRLPGRRTDRPTSTPGAAPGIEYNADVRTPPRPGEVKVHCVDYDSTTLARSDVQDLAAFLNEPRPDGARVRWLKIDGLHPYVVNQVREAFGFHTLAAEDVMNVPQRPRVEDYDDHVFVVAQFIVHTGERVSSQQVSVFYREDLVVSFHERSDDLWAPVFARLAREGSNIRNSDGSYLMYAILDTVVDHAFPVLENYAERLEKLEDEIMGSRPRKEVLGRVHAIKRELAVLQRILWPTRELVGTLSRAEQPMVEDRVRAYLLDVQDHCVQLKDMVDTFRELAAGLTELHLSMTNNRMGEVMHLLTLMSSVFIPITFIAGVYGMNFQRLPELHWQHGYEMFWVLCVLSTGGMLWYFRHRGWL